MKIDKKYILETIIKSDNTYNHAILKNIIIPKEYLWCKSKIEYIEAVLYDLKEAPHCYICNTSLKYDNTCKYYPKYKKYCSHVCEIKDFIKDVPLTKEFIEEYFLREDGNYNVHKTKVVEIPQEYSWCKTKSEYLDCIRYEIKEQPKCKNCNKPVKYLTSSKNIIKYQDFCSISCVNKYTGTKEKIKKTNIKKYGKEYYTQTKEYLSKTEANNLKKYGYKSTNQRDIKNVEEFNNLNYDSLTKWLNDNNLFRIFEFMEYFNVTRKTVNDLKNKLDFQFPNIQNRGKTQKEIYSFLNNETNNILYDTQEIIQTKKNKFELDIYLPDYNFAVEYNGLTFHSFGYHDTSSVLNNYKKEKELISFNDDNQFNKNYYEKDKHLLKTELSEKKGIQLFHIFENEWLDTNKRNIWKSMLLSKMNKNTRIFARKCIIKEVNRNEAEVFCEENHIQGYVNSSIRIGLYYNDILISLMTFGKSRRDKWKGQNQYELYRFCSKLNTTVVGGASKLLKYFELKYKPKLIISYANRRWSQGNLYEKLNFELVEKTLPNFFYFKLKELNNDNFKLESREKYQKYKLQSYFEKEKIYFFDENLPGNINMFMNGYRRIWDSGNFVYIKTY